MLCNGNDDDDDNSAFVVNIVLHILIRKMCTGRDYTLLYNL